MAGENEPCSGRLDGDDDTMKALLIIVAILMVLTAQAQTASITPVPMKDRITATTIVTKGRVMKTVPVKMSQTKYSWRVCHDGARLKVVPFFSDGETWTPHLMVECPTLIEAKAEIIVLALKVSAEQQAKIDALEEVPIKAVIE